MPRLDWPTSRWVKGDRLHPLVPRETARWRKLGRLPRSEPAVLGRVRLHADLTILAKLSMALTRQRAPLSYMGELASRTLR